MGSGHSKSRFSKQQQPSQYPQPMPAPYHYPPPLHQPVIPGYPGGLYPGASYPAPHGFVPPGYPQPGMHPQHLMNWAQPPERQRRKRRTTRRERYSEDYASGRDHDPPVRSRSAAQSRSRRASEPAPPPVIPQPRCSSPVPSDISTEAALKFSDSYSITAAPPPMHDLDSSRRAPTPFLAPFPDPDVEDEESESDSDREPTSRHGRSQSRASRRSSSRRTPVSFPQPSVDPGAYAAANAHVPRNVKNPLPAPPRDIYETTPYKQLLHLPQTTALLNTTYGTQQYPPMTMPVPQVAPAAPPAKQESKNPVKGLLRRLSTKKEKKTPSEQPQVRFVPVFVPSNNQAGPSSGAGLGSTLTQGRPPPGSEVTMPVLDVPRPPSRAHSVHSRHMSYNGAPAPPVMMPQPSVGPSDHGHGGGGGRATPAPPGAMMPQPSIGGGGGGPERPYTPAGGPHNRSFSMPEPTVNGAPISGGGGMGGIGGGGASPNSAADTSSDYIMPVPPVPTSPPEIRFDQDTNSPYWGFMNHSPHRIRYRDQTYPTALHLHEAIKYLDTNPDLAARIRNAVDVHDVYPLSAQFQAYERPDWGSIFMDAMEDVLYHKFKQHADLRIQLLDTRTSRLVYSDRDDGFWGAGPDGNGHNQLGKALMRVRERLRSEPGT